jgi:hypothetical protein
MPAFQAAVDMDRLIQRSILPLNAYTRCSTARLASTS